MKVMDKKGQAEIMDGLILMLVAATCSVVMLSISANYGTLPIEIYEETYSQKLAQNTLLSLYHITYLEDFDDPLYKKSLMVGISRTLSEGDNNPKFETTTAGRKIAEIFEEYYESLGWHFIMFITDSSNIVDSTIISSHPEISDETDFRELAGSPSCASSALTYQDGAFGCGLGRSAGDMCYAIFEICVWQT